MMTERKTIRGAPMSMVLRYFVKSNNRRFYRKKFEIARGRGGGGSINGVAVGPLE